MHFALCKMSSYIDRSEEKKDLAFKHFSTALFRCHHLPNPKSSLASIVLEVAQDFSCEHFFQIPSQSFAHRIQIQSVYSTGKLLAQERQDCTHLSTIHQYYSTAAFLQTMQTNSMWIPAICKRPGEKLPPHLSFQMFQISVV